MPRSRVGLEYAKLRLEDSMLSKVGLPAAAGPASIAKLS